MALGFGFNKAKVLASAEKFVQQGKLQNAIAEYAKIIKEDPKDLTVLNTLGDLCARVGQNEHATQYFKKVGDHYAQDGFTVKAIAIYKKLTRLSPGDFENVNRLADLYSQQGLLSDARAQYMQVADHLLKSGDNTQAARVLQKILELDPESAATQSKLADLYVKLGKKAEARNIYYAAAEALHARGAYDAAEEALGRVISLDPQNASALLLRGMIAAGAGDNPSAIQYLEQVSDLDSRPDALRALLRAKLQSGTMEGVDGVASKLVAVHNDLSGIGALAEWHIANNRIASALNLYDSYADRFMAADPAGFQQMLHPLIGRIRDNPDALGAMSRLLQRAGDTSHRAEIMELQAHACAQKSEFEEARDLYRELAEMEPDNPLHGQNYKQMLGKLGEDPATRVLSAEEAVQAFMVEELEQAAPVVHQSYDSSTEKAIEAALTDAELFASYNVPAKAIPPLEAVLPRAPRDITLNQRLASLYARGGRYADAARACQLLSEVYRELGHESEAVRYLEAAKNYSLRAPAAPAPAAPVTVPVARTEAPPADIPEPPTVSDVLAEPPAAEGEVPVPSVQEFSFDVPDHLLTDIGEPARAPAPAPAEPPAVEMKVRTPEPAVEPPALAPAPAAQEPETDTSSEWESMLSVETAPVVEMEAVAIREKQPVSAAAVESEAGGSAPCYAVEEKVQEIQSYIARGLWDAARRAILDLTEVAPDAPQITELIAAVSAGRSRAEAAAASVPKPAAAEPPVAMVTPAAEEFAVTAESEPAKADEPVAESPLSDLAVAPAQAAAKRPVPSLSSPLMPPAAEEAPLEDILGAATEVAAAPAPSPLAESTLEDVLEAPLRRAAKAVPAASAAKEKATEDILTDFVRDLEKSDLKDFVPRAKPEPVPPQKPPAVPAAAPVASAVAAAAPAPTPEARVNGEMKDAESASVLNNILSELQSELEEETAGADEAGEDPETHYNLGIAFKEMGLLDEAIGELQKVCHAIDGGSSFSQPIQAYTWLAQCLVDKGAPEAAVRWYQSALHLPGLDDGSRCAIYYDLALAFEASGDKKSALANFMEVYGSNIDFRDVASRIKALRS